MKIINSKNGFGLTELILVIATLSILAAVSIPRDNGLAPISLDAAARKVKEDLRFCQSMATTTGDAHGFRVTGDSTYEIYNVVTGNMINSPYTNQPMQEDLSTNFGGAQFSNLNYLIEFNTYGRPTVGGGTIVQLEDGAGIKQIQVTQTSGYISLL